LYFTSLTIWVTCWVSYKGQEIFTLCEHLGPHPVFVGFAFLIFLIFCVCIWLVNIVYSMWLDCPFLIIHLFFCNVYLRLNSVEGYSSKKIHKF
jgi:hypothetical protein